MPSCVSPSCTFRFTPSCRKLMDLSRMDRRKSTRAAMERTAKGSPCKRLPDPLRGRNAFDLKGLGMNSNDKMGRWMERTDGSAGTGPAANLHLVFFSLRGTMLQMPVWAARLQTAKIQSQQRTQVTGRVAMGSPRI